MKKLPKHFAIKTQINHPLWSDFEEWLSDLLNQKIGTTRKTFRCRGYYGWFGYGDDCRYYSSNDKFIRTNNTPKIITLEKWYKIMNSKQFKYGDEVRGRESGTAQWKNGIYIAPLPCGEDYHVLFDKKSRDLIKVYKVDERTLDGETREIDGHKYELKLIE